MSRLTTVLRRGAIALMLVALAACQATFQRHGYVPSDAELEYVTVGKSTQESVASIIGRPSSSGVLTGSGWYYVGSRWKHFGPRAPQEIDRQVVAVTFDDQGVVENVERFGLENGQVVAISRRVTDSNIKGISLIGQLLGNLGNFRAGDILE